MTTDGEKPRRAPDPMIVLFIMLALAAAGWVLIDHLMSASKLQDCVMSGRRNCAPIDDPNPR